MQDVADWGGKCITPEDFWGVMYYIGKIYTGVPPGLGGAV